MNSSKPISSRIPRLDRSIIINNDLNNSAMPTMQRQKTSLCPASSSSLIKTPVRLFPMSRPGERIRSPKTVNKMTPVSNRVQLGQYTPSLGRAPANSEDDLIEKKENQRLNQELKRIFPTFGGLDFGNLNQQHVLSLFANIIELFGIQLPTNVGQAWEFEYRCELFKKLMEVQALKKFIEKNQNEAFNFAPARGIDPPIDCITMMFKANMCKKTLRRVLQDCLDVYHTYSDLESFVSFGPFQERIRDLRMKESKPRQLEEELEQCKNLHRSMKLQRKIVEKRLKIYQKKKEENQKIEQENLKLLEKILKLTNVVE